MKFKIGDIVHYTNPQGVYIGIKKIIRIDEAWNDETRYYIEPSDSWWYPVKESNLSHTKGAE